MNKEKDNFIYLKCGSNILRIQSDILEGNLIDYSDFLEVLVADGHGKYHFEKNKISVCIAEDYDIKQLKIVDDPVNSKAFKRVRLGSNTRCNMYQLCVEDKIDFVIPVREIKRKHTVDTKEVVYAK